MSNFAALLGALMKRGSWSGPTLTPKDAELGTRVRFTGGALAGNEATVISYYPGCTSVSIRLDTGHVKPKVPIERLQVVGKLPEAQIQKLREAVAASVPPVPSVSTGQANYVPPPTVQNPHLARAASTTTVSVTSESVAQERPPPPPQRKPKAKPLIRRKADWDF